MEMITRSRYAVEKIGVHDLSEHKEIDNQVLIDEILAQGDRIGYKSNVKAPMTEWNMCYESVEFQKLANIIVRDCVVPYLGAYFNNLEDIKRHQYAVVDMWGADYRGNGEDFTQKHDHRMARCAFSYYLQTPEGCPPLVFDDMRTEIHPKPGMCVTFIGDYMHSVPTAVHDGSRIMIAGNVMPLPPKEVMVASLQSEGYQIERIQDS